MSFFHVPSVLGTAVICLFIAMSSPGQSAEQANSFKVGVAATDVTPPVPYAMAGYYYVRLSTGTLDPLYAKAMVFEQEKNTSCLLVFDLISMRASVTSEIRKRAAAATKIAPENIIITATHSHTGPVRNEYNPKATHEANVQAIKDQNSAAFNYELYAIEKGVEAIVAAQKNLRAATLHAGKTQVPDLSFNRRFHMKSGGDVVFNPGIKNPDIDRAAGPIDPEVPLVLFSDPATGKPFASLTSFALHLDTTGGLKFSADYPCYLASVLKEKYGNDFFSVFATGTCGDINHIDVSGKFRRRAPEIGKELGQYVVKGLAEKVKSETPQLAANDQIVIWPRKVVTDDEVKKAKGMEDAINNPAIGKYTFLERVRAGMTLKLASRPKDLKLEVQAIRLSEDTAIVSLPGEVFVDLGLAIKKGSPFANTFVLELAQDDIIYVPTVKAFKEGSYETINSTINPGGGEKLVEVAIEALKKLKK